MADGPTPTESRPSQPADTSSYPSAQHFPLGTEVTVYAIGEDGPGRRLGHGAVVDHPSPHHVTVESPFGTKRVAPISHVGTTNTPRPAAGTERPGSRWIAICDALDTRIAQDPHWPALVTQFERAEAAGTDVTALLRAITVEEALPEEHPGRSLAYRLADAAPDVTSPGRTRFNEPDRPTTPPAAPPPAAPRPVGYRPGPPR